MIMMMPTISFRKHEGGSFVVGAAEVEAREHHVASLVVEVVRWNRDEVAEKAAYRTARKEVEVAVAAEDGGIVDWAGSVEEELRRKIASLAHDADSIFVALNQIVAENDLD